MSEHARSKKRHRALTVVSSCVLAAAIATHMGLTRVRAAKPDEQALSVALHAATIEGDAAKVADLLKQGAPVNRRETKYGLPPLHYAIIAERQDVVEVLESYGADHRLEDVLVAIEKVEFFSEQRHVTTQDVADLRQQWYSSAADAEAPLDSQIAAPPKPNPLR